MDTIKALLSIQMTDTSELDFLLEKPPRSVKKHQEPKDKVTTTISHYLLHIVWCGLFIYLITKPEQLSSVNVMSTNETTWWTFNAQTGTLHIHANKVEIGRQNVQRSLLTTHLQSAPHPRLVVHGNVESESVKITQELTYSGTIVGLKGDKGDTGPVGLTGPTGNTGAPGLKGETGNTGAPGLKGETGNTGAPGEAGPVGLKGETGNTGLQGEAGLTGAPGLKGETGPVGLTGAPGLKGETGPVGLTGAPGLKGETGNTGLTGAPGLKGETGPVGLTGAPGLKGDTGGPGTNGTDGKSGEHVWWEYNANTNELHIKKDIKVDSTVTADAFKFHDK